ncbi:MAG TPA: alpha/beta fold hydrolase [Longimicrobiaceae bacterium]|nr:alpha/beta fold hydrolase [Longimicrobiaceae bacterium]
MSAAVPVRATGSKRPLFLVHDGAGSVEYAYLLAPHLDPDVPVYALPAPSRDAPLRTVEGMAARLTRMVREARPAGPYRLAGASFGGLLACEVAVQLIGQDQTVEFVGIIDDRLPGEDAHPLREYIPQLLPVPVHLFPGQGSTEPGPGRGWHALLPGNATRVTPVPGTEAGDLGALGEAVSREIGRAAVSPQPLLEEGYSPLVTLRFGRSGGVPLFCVPGAGASVAAFTELAGCLDPSRPVHAFQPRGLDGDMVPHSTVPAVAELYLRSVREAQPSGSVHLLGHSFGGWVAFEMARRLRESGRSVGSLTILDSEVPDEDGARVGEYDAGEAFLELVQVFELTAERSLEIAPGDVESLDEPGRLRLLHGRLVRLGLMSWRSSPEVLRGPFRTFSACLRAAYRPTGVYPDRLLLVLVGDDRYDEDKNCTRFVETVRGWTRWAPGLAFSVGVGNHMTVLKKPHVQSLASMLTLDPASAPGLAAPPCGAAGSEARPW